MSDTQIRVPRMQGLPKQTFGFTEIRSRSKLIFVFPPFYYRVMLTLKGSGKQVLRYEVG
jgi:hypothetical protein